MLKKISIFIAMINTKKANIVVGCVPKHPNMDGCHRF